MSVCYRVGDHDIRPWGTWEVIAAGENYVVKKIVVLSGQQLSLQLHHHRDEHWIIADGTADVTLGNKIFSAPANTPIFIRAEQKHRIANRTKKPIVFIEVQTGETLDENDIVRFEDDYGRI